MKKILILCVLTLAVGFASCNKEEPSKDVEVSIKKLNYFNQSFDEFMSDGVISRDTVAGEKSSEYDKVKKTATEYYELINKINGQIKDEHKRIEKGKKIHNYEEKYNKALEEKKSEIDAAVAGFEERILKLKESN